VAHDDSMQLLGPAASIGMKKENCNP
jgi:hypothetical protein